MTTNRSHTDDLPQPPASVNDSRTDWLGFLRNTWLAGRQQAAGWFPIWGKLPFNDPLQLRTLLAGLAEERQKLDQLAREVENRFLAIGAGMQEITVLSDHLLKQSDRLAILSGTEWKTRLLTALEVIQQQLAFVMRCHEANDRLISRLDNYTGHVHQLHACDADLGRILLPLQTTNILYRIQSISLPAEDQSFFATLTENIASLQSQARATFADQFQQLLATRQTIESAIPGLKEQSLRQKQQVAHEKARIEASLGAMRQELDQIQADHERMAETGKQVSTATGRAVVGLQYQDITRQKWEHVAAALDEMCRRSASASAQDQKRLPPDVLGFLRETSRLQDRQMQAIQEDLVRSHATIHESLQIILKHLQGMDGVCQLNQLNPSQEEKSGAMAKLVQVMLDTLASARSWVAEIAAIARSTCDTVDTIDKTASDVAGTLRRLSTSIGWIAINAQVQAARVGQDTGLETLSEYTTVVAREIQLFSQTIGAEFDGLVRELHDTVVDCRNLREQALAQQHWLEDQGRQLEGQLSATRDQALALLHEVNQALRETHQQGLATLGAMNSQEAGLPGMDSLPKVLGEITRCADALLGGVAPAAGVAGQMESLKNRYTMESERALHASVMETRTMLSPACGPAIATQDMERPSLPLTNPEVGPADAGQSSMAQPAAAPSVPAEPSPEPPANPAGKSEFGDNIELF